MAAGACQHIIFRVETGVKVQVIYCVIPNDKSAPRVSLHAV